MTWEQRMEILVRDGISRVQETAAQRLPDTHRFAPIGSGMRIPDSEFVAYIIVACDECNPHGRRVCIRVLKEGTDRAYEQLFPSMTSAEIRRFLAGPKAYRQIRRAIDDLWTRAKA